MPERKVSFFWTAFALLALAWGAGFLASLVEYATSAKVIGRFALSWELARTGSRFLAWIPALVFSACAVGANLVAREGRDRRKAASIAGGAAALALAAGAALVFLAPVAAERQRSYETRSALFLKSRESAEKALQDKDFATALDFASLAVSIDPTESASRLLRDKALAESNRLIALPSREEAAPRSPERLELSAADFLRIALEAEARGDWYTAHYEAGEALVLDPRMAEARLLQSRAWERIRDLSEDPELAGKADFFSRKLAAYGSLREGDALRAWREFSRLAAESPRDPDVTRYLAESEEALRHLAYFADEARAALGDHPSGPILARLESSGTMIIFSATASAAAGSSTWLRAPELTAVAGDEVLWQVGAPYGLLESDALLLRGVGGKDSEPSTLEPVTYRGAIPWEAPGSLPAPMDPKDARLFASLGAHPSTLVPGSLLEAARTSSRFGLDSSPYAAELALRAGAIAGTLALALVGAGLGVRLGSPRRPGALVSLSGLALIAATSSPVIAALASSGERLLAAFRAILPGTGVWLAWGASLAVIILAGIAVAARYLSRD